MTDNYVIGVGDSDAAVLIYDIDVYGSLKAYAPARLVPTDQKGQLAFAATFGLNEANFEWNEMALFVDGRFIKRKVIKIGRKPPISEWVVTFSFDANGPSIDLDIKS